MDLTQSFAIGRFLQTERTCVRIMGTFAMLLATFDLTSVSRVELDFPLPITDGSIADAFSLEMVKNLFKQRKLVSCARCTYLDFRSFSVFDW